MAQTPQQREREAREAVGDAAGWPRSWQKDTDLAKALTAYKRAILAAERAKGRKETKR